jgi:hypothetical protein
MGLEMKPAKALQKVTEKGATAHSFLRWETWLAIKELHAE